MLITIEFDNNKVMNYYLIIAKQILLELRRYLMALQIKKLYNEGMSLYKMRLIAGKGGLDNLVQWVHTIEDEEASSFLHGQELVFTAGIRNTKPNWLTDFAKRLNSVGTSAFVINLGPHIKKCLRRQSISATR